MATGSATNLSSPMWTEICRLITEQLFALFGRQSSVGQTLIRIETERLCQHIEQHIWPFLWTGHRESYERAATYMCENNALIARGQNPLYDRQLMFDAQEEAFRQFLIPPLVFAGDESLFPYVWETITTDDGTCDLPQIVSTFPRRH